VQLPHYIFVALPFAAIITGNFLHKLLFTGKWQSQQKYFFAVHGVLFTLLWIALIVLLAIPFTTIPWYVVVIAAVCFAGYLLLLMARNLRFPKLLAICCYTSIGLNIFLNTAFYPALLQYQAGNIATAYINKHQLPKEQVTIYSDVVNARRSIHFYSDYFFKKTTNPATLAPGSYVITDKTGYSELMATTSNSAQLLFTGKGFAVTKLSLKFLNPATRDGELEAFYILRMP